ncbi:hypothetical protein Q044_00361 [Pseudomonas aeruginosa BWHPSA039]|nr:hypothetical protein Q044_00361 [Pseudomonas aeruginosa BWHPSA039]
MIPELGHLAMILALCFASVQAVLRKRSTNPASQ